MNPVPWLSLDVDDVPERVQHQALQAAELALASNGITLSALLAKALSVATARLLLIY